VNESLKVGVLSFSSAVQRTSRDKDMHEHSSTEDVRHASAWYNIQNARTHRWNQICIDNSLLLDHFSITGF